MRIIHRDIKHGVVKIKIDSTEDLWYLESIITPNDLVSGMTERKIKLGGSEDKSKISKRILFLKIRAEKIDTDNGLRVSGPIIEAPDDIPKGDFHTFGLEIGTVITIEKERWSSYEFTKLEEASKEQRSNILIVAFDREEAIFAELKNHGFETILDLKGDVSKKDFEEKKGNFYSEIYSQIKSYDEKNNYSNIIIASPAFWKDYLMKEIEDERIRKKITLATCSSIDGSTISEIMKRPELKTVLDKDKSSKETKLVEELLDNIRKDNAGYGIRQVKEKIISGNISVLLVSEDLIKKTREEKRYFEIDKMMNDAQSINADIRIISTEEAIKKLDGLGGIACLLRWKENYS